MLLYGYDLEVIYSKFREKQYAPGRWNRVDGWIEIN